MSEVKKKSSLKDLLDKIPFLKKIKNIKHIEIIICIIFISLLLLIYFSGTSSKKNAQTSTNASTNFSELSFNSSAQFIKETEAKLKSVISSINGVGQTNVMITLESGPEIKIANTVEEKTIYQDGKSQNVSIITTPIIVTENGENKPIILMEILPKIKGVIIVAKGADNVKTKLDIYQAVEAIISVSSENIQVFAG